LVTTQLPLAEMGLVMKMDEVNEEEEGEK